MAENEWSSAEKTVKGLTESLLGVLEWSWEGRFGAALAQFTAADTDKVIGLIRPHFVSMWDSSIIAEAGPRITDFCAQLGGLRSGQLLFASDPDQDILLFGAWWPWGNGQTISIRIIPAAKNLEESDKQAFTEQFKAWFGM